MRSRRSVRELVRSDLRRLPAYHLDQVECRYKLDQNEVPWDFPARLKARVSDELRRCNWAHYPDFHGDRLRRALGSLHDWPCEGVLIGNGSNELLGVILEAVVGPGREVLGAEPSFGLYEMFVRRAGGVPRFLPPRADLTLPLLELEAEIERQPQRALLLCSPNNPTGAAAPPEAIVRLLERLDAPLLLDNAYGEFCRYDYRPLLGRYPHLVLLRTLSKAWSLAGIRLGYLLAAPDLVDELIKVKLPYNVGHPAQEVGLAAVAARELAARRVRLLRGRREQWGEMLRAHGLEVFPSEGNFLLVRAGDAAAAAALRRGLAQRGILVRDVGRYPGLAACLRFGVGSGPALRATRRVIEELQTDGGAAPKEEMA